MPDLRLPAVGGARTLEQLEALARLRAGEDVPPDQLHSADRPTPVKTKARAKSKEA